MTDRIAQLEKLLEAEPDDPFCLYSLGQEHAKAERHEQAVTCFSRAIEADPDYLYAYYHKARSLEAVGEKHRAIESLRTGLEHARNKGDEKAAGELSEYLHALT